MRIITPKGMINTEEEAVALMFNDDDELGSFISLLVKTPVRSTGIRLLTLMPDNVELTPLQMSILNVIEGMDGFGGDDHENICDNAIDGLKDILKS